jgi:eukaryotic-like serine/threonine-protein kinase
MDSETDLGRIVGDRYLLLDSIGHGGMADVHLARDERDGHLVALKWLARSRRTDPTLRERMRLEAELLAQVKHPNVVRLFDYGITRDGVPFLVLEALTGETLHENIARRGAMPVEQALPFALQLASAVDAVHRAGLVHGDVKPHNVFLCGECDSPQSIKLIDFGFAQACSGDGPIDSDVVAGTLEYMSPEQILSDRIDARSDIYSFGIVLFRWLTAELPFETGPILGLFAHHLESKAPPPSWLLEEIHPGLEKIILAAMRKNPVNRYASMSEVIADLECVLTGKGEVRGTPIIEQPDAYQPKTERAMRACNLLCRKGLAHQSPPWAMVRAPEPSAPAQSGVRASGKEVDDLQEAAAKIATQ